MTRHIPTLTARAARVAASLALASAAALPLHAIAQDAGASAPAAAAAPATPSSPAKRELVQKILTLQQGGIENMARQLVQEPAGQLVQQAGMVLQQRVAPEKREAVGKDLQAEVKKYMDETVPIVRDRAIKLAPSTVGPVLESNFNEDELRQVIAFLESPVNRKYQQLAGDMQRALVPKVVSETRTQVEPKVRALEQGLSKRLTAAGAGPAASGPAPGKGK